MDVAILLGEIIFVCFLMAVNGRRLFGGFRYLFFDHRIQKVIVPWLLNSGVFEFGGVKTCVNECEPVLIFCLLWGPYRGSRDRSTSIDHHYDP